MEEKKNIVSKIVDWVQCAMCGQPILVEDKRAICLSCGTVQIVDKHSKDEEKEKISKKIQNNG